MNELVRKFKMGQAIPCVTSTIRMHLFELVFCTMQSCPIAYKLWLTLSNTYEKNDHHQGLSDPTHLWIKESDSIMVHLTTYERITFHLSSQGKIIDEELYVVILMSDLPLSWETFVTMVWNAVAWDILPTNASMTNITYAFTKGYIFIYFVKCVECYI